MAVSVQGALGTPAFRTPSGSSSMTVTNPFGGASGDITFLFLFRAVRVSGVGTPPDGLSGWTSLFDDTSGTTRFGVWYKDWASGDLTLSSLEYGVYYAATMMHVRGGSTTGITYSSAATGTNTTVAGGSLTAASGDLLFSTLAIYDPFTSAAATVTAPSGMTSRTSGTSSDLTDLGGGYDYVQLYVRSQEPSAGSTGTRSWTADDPLYNLAQMIVRNIIVPQPGSTTHLASAALSSTSTVTAAMAATRAAAAALSSTSTVTAAAAATRAAAAEVSAALSISASATVTPGPETVSVEILSTSSVSASAALTALVDTIELTVSSYLSAGAALTRPAAAAVATSSSIAATMLLDGEVPTTSGHIRGVVSEAASIRPRGGVTAPTIAALVSIDASTLTAVVDTSASRSPLGVPVFVGGSVSPVAAGLIAAGLAHVWFADDGIHVQGAS